MTLENELEKYFRLGNVEIEKFAIFRALIFLVFCFASCHCLNGDWRRGNQQI